MVKIKRTYLLEEQTVALIEHIAKATRRDYSAVVDIAVEDLAAKCERSVVLAGAMVPSAQGQSSGDDGNQ